MGSMRASAAGADLPAPLTVTHLPPSTDLASTFASLGFTRMKTLKLEPDSVMQSHATPTPRLLGVAAGHFLISVDPQDPAENGGGGGGQGGSQTEALQLSPGTYLIMPTGVRHSAWVTGGAPVDLVVGEQEG